MTEVYLHGILAKKFKEKYCFSINSYLDIFTAIDTNTPNFITFLQNNCQKMGLSILVDKEVLKEDKFNSKPDMPKRIDLVPACEGSAITALGWFLISILVTTVISVIFAANSAKPPKMDNNSEQSIKTSSFEFSGEVNLEKQGRPVPVGYGRLRVGSYVVGSQIWNRNLFNTK